jgi:hypothetical protein
MCAVSYVSKVCMTEGLQGIFRRTRGTCAIAIDQVMIHAHQGRDQPYAYGSQTCAVFTRSGRRMRCSRPNCERFSRGSVKLLPRHIAQHIHSLCKLSRCMHSIVHSDSSLLSITSTCAMLAPGSCAWPKLTLQCLPASRCFNADHGHTGFSKH